MFRSVRPVLLSLAARLLTTSGAVKEGNHKTHRDSFASVHVQHENRAQREHHYRHAGHRGSSRSRVIQDSSESKLDDLADLERQLELELEASVTHTKRRRKELIRRQPSLRQDVTGHQKGRFKKAAKSVGFVERGLQTRDGAIKPKKETAKGQKYAQLQHEVAMHPQPADKKNLQSDPKAQVLTDDDRPLPDIATNAASLAAGATARTRTNDTISAKDESSRDKTTSILNTSSEAVPKVSASPTLAVKTEKMLPVSAIQKDVVEASAMGAISAAASKANSSLNESARSDANASSGSLTEEARMEMELQVDAEELSQAQIHTKLQPKVKEDMPFMLLKSESIRSQCFLKCLEHNPLSNMIYVATCHRGPNQRWKLTNEMMQYEYGTFKARVCNDFDDWHKAIAPGSEMSMKGKPYGFTAQSWTECRASCFSIPECKQAVYHKGSRVCKLLKNALDYDQFNRGGSNIEFISTQCQEGTGMPKCLTYIPATRAVKMLDCNSAKPQKWYFTDHKIKSRVNNGCLAIKHVAKYGSLSNDPWNELEVKDKCDSEDQSHRWHWA